MNKRLFGLLAIMGIIVAGLLIVFQYQSGKRGEIRYGITPYQDSGLPVVASALGWYKAEGLNVKLVPVTWGDVMPALSSGAVDVVIYNMNSFMPGYGRAAQRPPKPVFYVPVFAFKGQAVMVHGDKGWRTMPDNSSLSASEAKKLMVQVAKQLKGMRVGITKGTELEQIVLEGMKDAGLKEGDVTLIHGSPEVTLAAFLSGDLDAFAAGLTERVESIKRGAVSLYSASDVMPPVINGIVTTEKFVEEHKKELNSLVHLWFRTIEFMSKNVRKNSRYIRDYLRANGSTDYTPEEYEIAWGFDVFPTTIDEANEFFNDKGSALYWKEAWDGVNDFLLDSGEISEPVPYDAYMGEVLVKSVGQ